MKHPITFFLMKTTGYIFDKLLNRRKIYYENKYTQSRNVKGPALIVSNHRTFVDYIAYFYTFYFKKLYVVTGDIFYRKNPFMTFTLNTIGSIRVKDGFNLSFVDESVKLLKEGKSILIFPEGHYELDDQINKFSPTYLKIALDADVPIIPTYTDGNYITSKRNRVIIGEKIYLRDYCKSENPSKEELEFLNDLVRNKIIELKETLNRRKKNPLFSIKNLFMDFGRVMEKILFGPFFRMKIHHSDNNKNDFKVQGKYIIAANHTTFNDPFILMNLFWRRRLHILTAKEVFANKKLRSFLLKSIGCVKIDREIADLEAMTKCQELLESDKLLAIFPEGHIQRDNRMSGFKNGLSMLAIQTSTPVLPIFIIKRKGYLKKVNVFIGRPINPNSEKYRKLSMMKQMSLLNNDLYEEIKVLESKAEKEGFKHEWKRDFW